jgi:4-hydroxy-tetrahydrodipicolinate reductase
LEQACHNGGATLHGSGINPGFAYERLALTLTGLMTDIDLVNVTEVTNCVKMLDKSPAAALFVGWGHDPATLTPESPSHLIIDPYCRDMLAFAAARMFGAAPEEVTIESAIEAIPAERRFEHPALTVEPGQTITVHHSQQLQVRGRRVLTNDAYWYLGAENVPIGGPVGDSTYVVRVEGKPAAVDVRMNVDSTMGDDIPVTTYITAVPLLQAVVPACEADPGIMYPDARPHWCSDFRLLAREITGLPMPSQTAA